MVSTDYNFSVPDKPEEDLHSTEIKDDEKITVNRSTYYYLIEQAEYLRELVHTDNLFYHIKSLGAKTYGDLKRKE
ncbi:MAG: hypothetical protein SGJ10_11555 [Bacteroidota bacterium]|nr:hypothetical protein [Bacteroidota bacterium]